MDLYAYQARENVSAKGGTSLSGDERPRPAMMTACRQLRRQRQNTRREAGQTDRQTDGGGEAAIFIIILYKRKLATYTSLDCCL